MSVACIIWVAIIGYFLGSIPTGFLVARAKGIDIRKVGSGNIGATNAFRILGKGPGSLVLLVDGLKGWAATAWLPAIVLSVLNHGPNPTVAATEWLSIVGGVASVLGHNFTCWLKFKGGKGIATSAGVLVALVPWALLIILILWILVFALSRYVSLASIVAAAALPIATWLTGHSLTLIVVTLAMSVLAIWKHRSNIHRLLNGTENRIGKKS